VIRIAITIEAFEAIAKTLPLGSVGYEVEAMVYGRGSARSRRGRPPKAGRN
jgi:hypothetical protein